MPENTAAVRTSDSVAAAPYATSVIPLFLASVTGFRYRTLNCMECGAEFLERNNDRLYRLNDDSQPAEIELDGSAVLTRCGACAQQYRVQVSLDVVMAESGIPMYLQPQSMYLAVDSFKKLRYIHCLECGRVFMSVSDRISQVIDNRVPFEYLEPDKLGMVEAMCFNRQKCGQTWSIML